MAAPPAAPLTVSGLPGPTIDNVAITDALCFGEANGSAQVQYSSGSAPYTLSWSNGSTGGSTAGLAAGAYTVTVTDNFGCSDAKPFNVQEPSALSLTATPVNMVSCFGGSDGNAEALANGGTAPYGYSWSNGTTTAIAGNLSAGTYSVIITDQHGCTEIKNTVISEPALLTTTQQTLTMVSCHGGSNGTASFSAAGGTAPYTYSWSNGAVTANTSGLSAGTYNLTVTDDKGCVTTSSVLITEPAAILFILHPSPM
jgi:hypothetical protein